jgi:hypothetical protein
VYRSRCSNICSNFRLGRERLDPFAPESDRPVGSVVRRDGDLRIRGGQDRWAARS